jgi:hypothetical protein
MIATNSFEGDMWLKGNMHVKHLYTYNVVQSVALIRKYKEWRVQWEKKIISQRIPNNIDKLQVCNLCNMTMYAVVIVTCNSVERI